MAIIKQETAVRKRQQIAQANRTMFLWVAGASAIVGLSAVLILTFGQRLFYNESVLAAKNDTVSALKNNNSVVNDLKDNIRVLNTNETLNKLKVPADKDSVQVVFDALPATANSAALGSALQSPDLLGRSNIKLESLNVTPISGVEDSGLTSSDLEVTTANAITFEFTVSTSRSNINALKETVQSLEKSIRAFNLKQMSIETQGDNVVMKVTGEGYYEPAKTVELKEKPI